MVHEKLKASTDIENMGLAATRPRKDAGHGWAVRPSFSPWHSHSAHVPGTAAEPSIPTMAKGSATKRDRHRKGMDMI